MKRTLLVTNDYPPKIGGIQNYLWELFRRLPPDEVCVLTTPHEGAAAFDAQQTYRIVRDANRALLPHPGLLRRVRSLAREFGAELVLLDPALPVGALGPRVGLPYGLVLHGAEVAMPASVAGAKQLLGRVLGGADVIVAAGEYVADAAARCAGVRLPTVVVPPGVDSKRFVPLSGAERAAARRRYGFEPDVPLVVGLSRLVPRKGFDVLIRAVGQLRQGPVRESPVREGPSQARGGDVRLAIAGAGRDRRRLVRLAQSVQLDAAPAGAVTFVGELLDDALPAFVGMADVFAMLCRDRWGKLEQEGFGIVFLEAAAAGVPAVAGRSGGSHEAVEHEVTGLVIDDPSDASAVAAALDALLANPDRRAEMGAAARARAAGDFDYDRLARKLEAALT